MYTISALIEVKKQSKNASILGAHAAEIEPAVEPHIAGEKKREMSIQKFFGLFWHTQEQTLEYTYPVSVQLQRDIG